MRSSKRAVALLAGAALATASLVGCSEYKVEGTANQAEGEIVEEVKEEEVVEEVVDEEAEGQAAVEAATGFVSAFLGLFAGDDLEAEEDFDESEGHVAEFFEALEIADYLTFANMKPEEEHEFKESFYYLAMMGMFDVVDEGEISFTVELPDEATVDGDRAEVNTNDGVVTLKTEDGETVEENLGELGFGTLKLIKEDGVWKVDALALAEDLEIEMEPEP